MSNQNKPSIRFWSVVIIAVVCGISAGILGEIFTRVYILKDFSTPYFLDEIDVAELNANRSGIVIRDAKKVVVNQDVKVAETINNIRPVIVSVFKEIDTENKAKLNYYKLNDPLFVGLIITSDGWVIASLPAELKNSFRTDNHVAINSSREIYKIEQISDFKDLPGDLVAFRLANASNLPVKKILSRSDLTLGETLLAVNGVDSIRPTNLVSLIRPISVLNSDELNVRLELADSKDSSLKNSFVFDLSGDLAAVIAADGEAVPAFSYNPFLPLFKGEKPSRPSLGINYLNLSYIKSPVINFSKGAWLQPAGNMPAVVKGGPAETAGLVAGDVITWVNNQEISSDNDLADMISSYRAGDSVTLTYWRDGLEKSVVVKLEELK
ncbi:MAG: PDZ domain-containing protein [Patescibacteria group bacterium]|jgi:hypothetical protein